MKGRGTIILVLLAAACITASALLQPRIRSIRTDKGLSQQVVLENSSPAVQFTTLALGGFRGIIADLFWYRIQKLQDEKRFFEIVQLSNWITQLEPRLASVWAYHAWNMSYNISVYFDAPEDRWRWVNHGLKLLRNEGLRLNPTEARLYQELSWIFFHKIGMNLDAHHLFFKTQIAKTWQPLENQRNLLDSGSAEVPEEIQALLSEWNMRLEAMQTLEQLFGRLDWRVPETHALYWAHTGLPYARDFLKKQLTRSVLQSLVKLTGQGLLEFDAQTYRRSPDLALLEPTLARFEEAQETWPDDKGFNTARANFVESVAAYLRTRQQHEKAAELEARYPEEPTGPRHEQDIHHD